MFSVANNQSLSYFDILQVHNLVQSMQIMSKSLRSFRMSYWKPTIILCVSHYWTCLFITVQNAGRQIKYAEKYQNLRENTT